LGGWWFLSGRPSPSNLHAAPIAWPRSFFLRIRHWLVSWLESPRPASAQESPALAAPASEPPLAEKLRALESAVLPMAESASHPRDFTGHASFRDAVSLLKSKDVPLKTVLQYALGTNWALSCVALAALAGRPDGADALDKVLAGFDRLAPWAMHY